MAESRKRSSNTADYEAQDDYVPQKRGKYTQVACNECKRRKLKCSGEDVCKRCISNGVSCVYAANNRSVASEETNRSSNRLMTLESRMSAMQRQLDYVSAELAALLGRESQQPLRNLAQTPNTSNSSRHVDSRWANRAPISPSYVGPTSSEFGLDVPNDTDEPDLDEIATSENMQTSLSNSPHILPMRPAEENINISATNPLLSLTETEAQRLVGVYENAVGLMYPVVDLDGIREYITDFYNGSTHEPSPPQSGNEAWWFSARDTEVLKVVLALALMYESQGRSELGDVLAASVENTFASTRIQVPEVDMKELIILTLVALYHAFRDDHVLAWRSIGLAARGAMQIGLHSSETWRRMGGIFPGDLERCWAINLFWCIYVFDKEFAFETGLPFVMRDSDMDSALPEPSDTNSYLACMIVYCRIGIRAWDLTAGWGSKAKAPTLEDKDDGYFTMQLHQWQGSLPPHFRLQINRNDWSCSIRDPNLAVPQILLHLRANQMEILLRKKDLLNASREAHFSGVTPAVYAAVDTIETLCKVKYISTIYHQKPQLFNRFLFSALAALFLGAIHAHHGFAGLFHDNVPIALSALKRSSVCGKYSRRLQKVIKNLKHMNLKRPPHRIRDPAIDSSANAPSHFVRSVEAGAHSESNSTPAARSTVDIMGTHPPTPAYALTQPLRPNENVADGYNDLATFFEFAGDYFMDPQLTQHHLSNTTISSDIESSQQFPTFTDVFQTEDDTLTRLMSGLL